MLTGTLREQEANANVVEENKNILNIHSAITWVWSDNLSWSTARYFYKPHGSTKHFCILL